MNQEMGRTPRQRRSFTLEYKAEVAELRTSGKTIAQVARDLELTATALRRWVAQRRSTPFGVRD